MWLLMRKDTKTAEARFGRIERHLICATCLPSSAKFVAPDHKIRRRQLLTKDEFGKGGTGELSYDECAYALVSSVDYEVAMTGETVNSCYAVSSD